MKPHNCALDQLLWMASDVLKREDPSNLHRRRDKRHTRVMLFEGGVGSDVNEIAVLFPSLESCGAGIFCFRWNPYIGEAVKKKLILFSFVIIEYTNFLGSESLTLNSE